jgi:hypothetical protein
MSELTTSITQNIEQENFDFVFMLLENYELSNEEKKLLNSTVQRIANQKNAWSGDQSDNYRRLISMITKTQNKSNTLPVTTTNFDFKKSNNVINDEPILLKQSIPANQQVEVNNEVKKKDNMIPIILSAVAIGGLLLYIMGTTGFILLIAFVSICYNFMKK